MYIFPFYTNTWNLGIKPELDVLVFHKYEEKFRNICEV